MRLPLVGIALAFCIHPPEVLAVDCIAKASALDKLVCGDTELRNLSDAMARLIGDQRERMIANAGSRQYATLVADQLAWREGLAKSCSPPLSADCLLPKYHERYDALRAHPAEFAGELYLRGGIKVGGESLELRSGQGAGLFLGDRQIAGATARIDVLERYTNSSVDALAFVAYRGGNETDCGQFPVYVVAVRPSEPAEILTVPNNIGSILGQSCIDRVWRADDALLFEIKPWPWIEGRIYAWKPKGGLFLRETTHFAPRPGTYMRDVLASRGNAVSKIENRQFYDALHSAALAADIDFAQAAEAFWFSWREPVRFGRYYAIDSCSRPADATHCTGQMQPKAVYDELADKLYFVFPALASPPKCRVVNGTDLMEESLRAASFYPARFRWPAGAIAALKEIYCRPDG